ncbi:MAG: toprim domain-containing protein [Nitrososphaeria archaeon]
MRSDGPDRNNEVKGQPSYATGGRPPQKEVWRSMLIEGINEPKLVRGGGQCPCKGLKEKNILELEKLKEIVVSLNNEIENGALIIVEGPKDAKALKEIGVRGRPYLYSHNSDHIELFNRAINAKKVIILVDNDKEGKNICKKLISEFGSKGIKYDVWYRRQLYYKIGKSMITHLEELSSVIKKFE